MRKVKMGKPLGFLLLMAAGTVMAGLGLSCSTTAPTSSNNFQNPIQTIAAINPPLTATFTFTPTDTATSTPTSTFTPTSTPYVVSAWTGFNNPWAVAVDGSGNVYVADKGHNQVGKYTPNGLLTASWGSGGVKGKINFAAPTGLAPDLSNNLYVVGNDVQVAQYGPNGNLANASFSNVVTFITPPQGVAFDSAVTSLYICDSGNSRVVQLNSNGAVTGFSGNSGILNLAPTTITGVTITSTVALSGIAAFGGNVFVATQGSGINGSGYSTVLGFTNGGSVTAVITGFKNPTGLAFDTAGNLYVADTGNGQVEEFSPNSDFSQVPLPFNGGVSVLSSPVGVAVDATGNIYVADSAANEVFKFAP